MLEIFGWCIEHTATLAGLALAFVIGAMINELVNNGWHGFFN